MPLLHASLHALVEGFCSCHTAGRQKLRLHRGGCTARLVRSVPAPLSREPGLLRDGVHTGFSCMACGLMDHLSGLLQCLSVWDVRVCVGITAPNKPSRLLTSLHARIHAVRPRNSHPEPKPVVCVLLLFFVLPLEPLTLRCLSPGFAINVSHPFLGFLFACQR